jgi:hypothetical protein
MLHRFERPAFKLQPQRRKHDPVAVASRTAGQQFHGSRHAAHAPPGQPELLLESPLDDEEDEELLLLGSPDDDELLLELLELDEDDEDDELLEEEDELELDELLLEELLLLDELELQQPSPSASTSHLQLSA